MWRIAFAEVFYGDKGGFDIVVGNPPYVRQESIADPRLRREDVTVENKKIYKSKLMLNAYRDYPRFFRYRQGKDTSGRKLDAKSDLYVYFYFRGLHLLNPTGSFVFITSNSWLDVGYGADLQEFLLRNCHVKFVIDNEVTRSFADVEVNTVICLLSAPDPRNDSGLEQEARFVMFTVPFEHVLSPIAFQELEEVEERRVSPEYRVRVLKQSVLLANGSDTPLNDEEETATEQRNKSGPLIRHGAYTGDKWGGKYLRAPDIYWTIVEQGKGRLVQLGGEDGIAEIQRGTTTGCNEFFYLDPEQIARWRIEPRFLKPVIKTPRDYYGIRIEPLPVWQFWCRLSREELAGTRALSYIEWGESQRFHEVPSCRSRRPWYALRGPEEPRLLWPSAFFERHIVYECPPGYKADKVFYTISGDVPTATAAYLNSSIVSLLVEVEGYQLNHGGIFVTTDWLSALPVLAEAPTDVVLAYESVAQRDIGLCGDEHSQPDRRVLDAGILRCLGFEDDAIDAVQNEMYASIQSYVAGRIHKARRETTKKAGRKRSEAADSTLGIWSGLPDFEEDE